MLEITQILLYSPSLDSRDRIGPSMADSHGMLEEIYEALVLGTRDYVRKNGFKQVGLGLNGGVDSALATVIATEAWTPKMWWKQT